MNKHSIQLSQGQRQGLEAVISKGQAPARKITHAQLLLKSAEGTWTDRQICEAFGVSETTIWRVRQRFLEHGLDDALKRRPQPERPQKGKLTGDQEAHLIALTCSPPPSCRATTLESAVADQNGDPIGDRGAGGARNGPTDLKKE